MSKVFGWKDIPEKDHEEYEVSAVPPPDPLEIGSPIPKIADSDIWGTPVGELRCPSCNEPNCMHQERVYAWFRDGEDGEATIVEMKAGSAQMYRGNPPSGGVSTRRRDGLIIDFTCEQCSYEHDGQGLSLVHFFPLEIVQHKGTTYISWLPPFMKA